MKHTIRLVLTGAGAQLSSDPDKPWAILRPGTFQGSTGPRVTVTEKDLHEMARAYDPAIERAAINFDHAPEGIAHGSLRDPFVKGGVLYAYPENLSEEARTQVETRRRFRQSAELTSKHQDTGGWYLQGLALLGASRSAVTGLPEITLAEGTDDDVLFEEPDPGAPAPVIDPGATAPSTAPDGSEESTMLEKKKTATAAGEENANPTATPEPAPTAELAAARQEIAAERQQLTAELNQARAERAVARQERATATVEKRITALGTRVTPGMLRTGLVTALAALAAAAEPVTVKLSQGKDESGKDKPDVESPVLEVILAAFAAAPTFAAAEAGEIAGANAEEGARLAVDRRSAAHRQVDLKAGITDEQAVSLMRRYPEMFKDEAKTAN